MHVGARFKALELRADFYGALSFALYFFISVNALLTDVYYKNIVAAYVAETINYVP